MTFRRFDTPLPSPAGHCLLAVLITLTVAVTGCRASSPSLDDSAVAPSEAEAETSAWTGTPTEADGVLPTGTTTADGHLPGIANLEPNLREALSRATEAARQHDVEIQVSSGWRSAAYQRHLWDQAILDYGSEEEAARWVATEHTSAHVTGEAVDIAPYDAIDWLVRRGAAFGFCQIYGNEPWHFELRPEAAERGCPPPYPDPSYDPRLQG